MPLNDYDPLFEAAGQQYNVDPQLLKAVAYTESRGDPAVVSGQKVSSVGAQGLMQFMPATAKALGIDPLDPKQAIPAAAKYISDGIDKYGSPQGALMAYAGGPNQAIWGAKTTGYPGLVADAYGKVSKPVATTATAQPQPTDDAFSAAFNAPSAKAATQPANDAFSAAFTAPTDTKPASAASTANSPDTGVHVSGLAGLVVDALRGKLGSNPIVNALSPLANSTPSSPQKDQSVAFSNDPTKDYDYALPFAQSKITGQNELALPQFLRGPLSSADALLQAARGTRQMSPGDKGIAGLQVVGAAPGTSVASRLGTNIPAEVAAEATQNRLAAPVPDPWGGRSPIPQANPLLQRETVPVHAQEPIPASQSASAPVVSAPTAASPVQSAPIAPNAGPAPVQPNPAWGNQPVATADAIPDKLPPKPILPIVTQSGANAQADRIIAHFAQNGPTDINAQEIIPGSTPTLSQATGNAGIATLERAFRDVNPNLFIQRAAANGDARSQALLDATGTPQDIEAAEAARDSATSNLRDAAFAPGNVDKADASPVVAKIDEILASPAGKRDAVQSVLTNIRAKLVNTDSNGVQTLENDPEQLYGVRKAINDSLSPLAAGTKADGRQAARELMQVQGALDDSIESGAPGFQSYIDAYSDASKPIDAMRYLQGLNLTDTKGNITLGPVDRAVKSIQKLRAANGVNPAKSLSDDQVNGLIALRDDLRRQGNETLGKSLGSNTFQNLATNSTMAALTGPLAAHATSIATGAIPYVGLPLAIGRYGLNRLGSRGEAMVQQALQNRLLNPETAARALGDNGAARIAPYLGGQP